jgi:hypothetical protein
MKANIKGLSIGVIKMGGFPCKMILYKFSKYKM